MRARGSITGPLVLIAIGILFLIHAITPEFRVGELLAQNWPYILIIWGVVALLEVLIRGWRGDPIPANGVSGAGWLLVIVICIAGLLTFEVRRPDNWWRQAGWERGIEAFGQTHDFTIEPIQRTTGATPHILIESFRGDAKIAGTDGTQVTVAGRKVVRAFETREAERADSMTPVEVVVQGNTVVIRCNQDKGGARTPVTTDLDISVPKGAFVEATGTVGDFDISSVAGVDITSGNAGVRLQDIAGNVKVETRRSDLVRCTGVKGTVDLRGRGTDVDLDKISGEVTISGDYTGTVSLRELSKPVRVASTRTELDLQKVPGEVRLDRGSLNMQDVVGPVKLVARSTDISLSGFTDGLDLTVDRGDVDLRPDRVPLGKIAVHARSGDIELSLPQQANFVLNANTRHGDIDNQFGEMLRQQTEGHGAKLEGTVGKGPDLMLETGRGNITVRKATGQEAPKTTGSRATAPVQQAGLSLVSPANQ